MVELWVLTAGSECLATSNMLQVLVYQIAAPGSCKARSRLRTPKQEDKRKLS